MRPKISVLMTSFNGEKYIKHQVLSILRNLCQNDELIISDDGSTDGSVELLKEFEKNDSRVVVYDGPHKGLNMNIRFLISKCSGDIIFISDQDDVWHDDKVSTIVGYFEKNPKIWLVHHNSSLINANGDYIDGNVYEQLETKKKYSCIKYLFKQHTFGSMTAFKKELLAYDFVPKYNYWDVGLVLYSIRLKSNAFIDDILMDYRRHDENLSTFGRRNFIRILRSRFHLFLFFFTKVLFKKKVK